MEVLDCLLKKYSYAQFKTHLETTCPDAIGFTAFTFEFPSALKMAELVKAGNPKIKVVIGGPQASAVPLEVMKYPPVDFVVLTEGEDTFARLVDALAAGDLSFGGINNFAYRQGAEVKVNPVLLSDDFEALPYSDFKAIDLPKYPKLYLAKEHPSAPIITSRGCPFSCRFCSGPKLSGKKFRSRSAANISAEIKH
ncbi:MAG: cobalamin-dependent protein [Deltaproteobacteria bacterium]|nr:cobalamin-dependent protein [Deltaproteobacteria bacterium]